MWRSAVQLCAGLPRITKLREVPNKKAQCRRKEREKAVCTIHTLPLFILDSKFLIEKLFPGD